MAYQNNSGCSGGCGGTKKESGSYTKKLNDAVIAKLSEPKKGDSITVNGYSLKFG